MCGDILEPSKDQISKVERGRSNGWEGGGGRQWEAIREESMWQRNPCDFLQSVRSVWENGSPVCLRLCVMRGRPVLLRSTWLSSSFVEAYIYLSPPLHAPPVLSVVGYSSSPLAKKDSRFSGVSVSHPFPSSWHQLSLSLHPRSCVHSSAVKLCSLFFFNFYFFNCRLSLDTSVIWLVQTVFYLEIFFFDLLSVHTCLLLHYAFIFLLLVSYFLN